MLHPDNQGIPFPLIMTGPAQSAEYFKEIDAFMVDTLGAEVRQYYQVIIDDPVRVAREMLAGMAQVRDFRTEHGDAYYFNWRLKIDHAFQQEFKPTHENMLGLELHKDQERHLLAANLRRAFSGIVAGNVKDEGIRAIEEHGLFEIRGDRTIMERLDALLASFVAQTRMKLEGEEYTPCYRIIK
jgi:hypothetical protein